MFPLCRTRSGFQAADKAGKAAQVQHAAFAFRQPGHSGLQCLVFLAAQHLDGTNRQVISSLQQRFIAVKVIAVHNERKSGAAQGIQHGGGIGITLISHLEHAEQLAGNRQVDDPALVHGMAAFIFHAGQLDIIAIHQPAGADHDPLAVDPAHIAQAVQRFQVFHLAQQLAVIARHAKEDIFQRGIHISQHGSGVDDGQLNILFAHRLDAAQRNAPFGEKILRRDLQHVHTAQQSDILPTGDDRADLRGTALHQTHGHGGDQRTGQRRAQAEYTGQRSERRSGILAVKQGEQECSHAAAQQDAGKLLLVFIRCAAGFAACQKAFHQAGGTADQHIGARFRQPGGHGAQYPGIFQPICHSVVHPGADKGKVIPDGVGVDCLACSVAAQQQRCGAGHQAEGCGVIPFRLCQKHDTLQDGGHRGHGRHGICGIAPAHVDQPGQAAQHRLPAQGCAGSKQNQHGHQQWLGAGCGIQRAKIGSGGRHGAQNDHNQGCSAHSDCCAGGDHHPQFQVMAHHGGIIGAFVFVAVQDGGLCGKRRFAIGGGFVLRLACKPEDVKAFAGLFLFRCFRLRPGVGVAQVLGSRLVIGIGLFCFCL